MDTPKPQGELERAAAAYARALRVQHVAAHDLDRALCDDSLEYLRKSAEDQHHAACERLGATEHDLMVAALVANGWDRSEAEEAV